MNAFFILLVILTLIGLTGLLYDFYHRELRDRNYYPFHMNRREHFYYFGTCAIAFVGGIMGIVFLAPHLH